MILNFNPLLVVIYYKDISNVCLNISNLFHYKTKSQSTVNQTNKHKVFKKCNMLGCFRTANKKDAQSKLSIFILY